MCTNLLNTLFTTYLTQPRTVKQPEIKNSFPARINVRNLIYS